MPLNEAQKERHERNSLIIICVVFLVAFELIQGAMTHRVPLTLIIFWTVGEWRDLAWASLLSAACNVSHVFC